MLLKYGSSTVIIFVTLLSGGRAFLFPLLFPVSVKITITSHKHHPPPPRQKPNYFFNPVPVYKEVVVKGGAYINPSGKLKHSYGDGHKYGTSYGDGHVKVYTQEHLVKNHKYANGYGYGPGTQYAAHEYVEAPIEHHKGSPYTEDHNSQIYFPNQDTHYKGTPYKGAQHPQTHHKGTEYQSIPQYNPDYQEINHAHHKGTEYQEVPVEHHKGTEYQSVPQYNKDYQEINHAHQKGTEYQKVPVEHYKGTEYQDAPETHYKGTEYQSIPGSHYKGTDYAIPSGHYKGEKKRIYNKNHSFLKSVGGYKLTDYLKTKPSPDNYDKGVKYVSHVAVPPKIQPGHTYAEIEAAHKVYHSPPKAYDSKEYADLGAHKYVHQEQYPADDAYLDDSLPAYKYKPSLYFDRKGVPAPAPSNPLTYAGFGTSVYGDSYAKMVYDPAKWKKPIRQRKYL